MGRKRKARVDPTPRQRERVLEKNAGVCCVCKRRYVGVHLHHTDGDSSNTIDDNLAVLCVEGHDEHHRPAAYVGPNHLELGPDGIRQCKRSWETFVADAARPHPAVIAVLNVYGSRESLHSMKLIFQRKNGEIEFERLYHLHDGPPESWIDLAMAELTWLGKGIQLLLVDEPLGIERCPCCLKSISSGVTAGFMTRLTAPTWESESLGAIYVNPTNPSIAIAISLKSQTLYQGHLHMCGACLHYVCDGFEERVPISESNAKAQAIGIVEKVLRQWAPATVLVATGDPDKPEAIPGLALPDCWSRIPGAAARNGRKWPRPVR